jgi:hypothetical protein
MKRFTAGLIFGFTAFAVYLYRQLSARNRRKLKRSFIHFIYPISQKLFPSKVVQSLFSCREPAGAANTPEYSNGMY